MTVTIQQLADALRLSPTQLRNLSIFAKRTQSYRHRNIPKRAGDGTRPLAAPVRDLRAVLDQLDWWLKRQALPFHDAAHGFITGRSITTHAAVHAGAVILITLDLADWFTTVKTKRLELELRSLGWSLNAARLVSRIATDEQTQALPQGAPTSPLFANLVARYLDRHLTGLAERFGCVYTRYADDLTFSSRRPMGHSAVERLLQRAEKWIYTEHFTVKSKKTHVMRPWQRMSVAGLVVNPSEKNDVRVSRTYIRRVRSAIHHHLMGHTDLLWTPEQLRSAIGFIRMVNPAQAEKLQALFVKVER